MYNTIVDCHGQQDQIIEQEYMLKKNVDVWIKKYNSFRFDHLNYFIKEHKELPILTMFSWCLLIKDLSLLLFTWYDGVNA